MTTKDRQIIDKLRDEALDRLHRDHNAVLKIEQERLNRAVRGVNNLYNAMIGIKQEKK